MSSDCKISAVIATRNRFDDITKCIESISSQTLLPDEIVIVDSSSSQELKSRIEEFRAGTTKFKYIYTKPGMTYQWNRGAEASSGDFVFFFDDDVILERDFIKEIMNIFRNDTEKKIGGVCGDVITPNRNYSFIYSKIVSIRRALYNKVLANLFSLPKQHSGRFRPSGMPTYPYGTNKILAVECLPSGATAYRKEVLNKFKYDETIHYMADADFSYRVSRKYQNVYTPYAKLIHTLSPAARESKYNEMKRLIETHHYLFKKNFPQSIKNKFAFWVSVTDLFAMAIVQGNKEGLKGLWDGLSNIRR
jgi:GT2 family glycosyltransferase